MNDDTPPEMGTFTAVTRLNRDLTAAAKNLGRAEARFLVDAYYTMQEDRKRAGNQVRALAESEEPHAILRWMFAQSETLEGQIKLALSHYAQAHPVGARLLTVKGIGPVIAAGLLAHIDIRMCPTAGRLWRFAGLDSTVIWPSREKATQWINQQGTGDLEGLVAIAADHFGRKPETLLNHARDSKGKVTNLQLAKAIARRPWNAKLKTLCWKIGESFVKQKGRMGAFYGPLYDQRKAYELQMNAEGAYREQALAIAAARPTHAQVATYKEGHLPDGHIHARCKRWVVKLFLAHLQQVWYEVETGQKPPKPYVIEHMGHLDLILPPF